MSLESILEHILNESDIERERIIKEAQLEADKILRQAELEAGVFYKEIFEKEKALYEAQKQKLIVNARLEQKKSLLAAKQELIDAVFKKLKIALKEEKFKKQQILADKVKEIPEDIEFFLANLRRDHETEVARILFK